MAGPPQGSSDCRAFPFAGLEETKELTSKFEFNPKDGIDNPALSLAEDSDADGAEKPRFCLLTKGDGESFGFCLREEVGYQGHIIRQVECGGVAQRRGLQDGDRILEVNGEYVDNMDHWRVVQKIKASGNQVAVAVLDGNAYEVAKALDKNLAELLPHHTRPRLCYVVKDKSGFGFRVLAPDGVKGTFRLLVTSDSPADKAGVPSDSWLLELNGASVRNYTHAQLTRKLKQSGSQVTLLVIDAKSEEFYRLQGVRVIAAMADASTLPFKARKLHMVKGPEGYGFLLKEEKCSSGRMGQFMSEVEFGLPAQQAGMKDGDRLLAVNGESVEDLGHQAVVDRICAGGNQVTLLVIDLEGDAFYSSVAPGSAGERAGLKEGDVVIEVNGRKVEKQSYEEVLARIKESGRQLTLLVVEQEGLRSYREMGLATAEGAKAEALLGSRQVPGHEKRKGLTQSF
ncbi:Na(+)/H(+) exchange regulatory cofactor NHE-RF4 isoform X3 [Carettochelys insculpta]|uniref:Na(+)/H(+) exchange regulatory cofactor NHE-RF4 isoform X3 n=1 Tax=Carettochelys insculpta TaxID=44489 RepID=UPI003EBE2106